MKPMEALGDNFINVVKYKFLFTVAATATHRASRLANAAKCLAANRVKSGLILVRDIHKFNLICCDLAKCLITTILDTLSLNLLRNHLQRFL
jgi:hypothetical protein